MAPRKGQHTPRPHWRFSNPAIHDWKTLATEWRPRCPEQREHCGPGARLPQTFPADSAGAMTGVSSCDTSQVDLPQSALNSRCRPNSVRSWLPAGCGALSAEQSACNEKKRSGRSLQHFFGFGTKSVLRITDSGEKP